MFSKMAITLSVIVIELLGLEFSLNSLSGGELLFIIGKG